MPIQVSYPGVYVQEISGGQPTVAGVSTSSTAFVDYFARGPMSQPVRVANTQDFDRVFGGLNKLSEASYGIRQYFLNGGSEGWVVRTGDGTAVKASLSVAIKTPGLPARVQASYNDFQAALAAAKDAVAAAEAANQALQGLQATGLTDQQVEEGAQNLRDESTQAALSTQQAAQAARDAAAQAQAASQELAIAIAAVAAASGPVADRTAMAANKSAAGANAAAAAAEATANVASVADRASGVAAAALRAGSAARTASAAASALQDVLTAIAATTAAQTSTAAEVKNADTTDLTNAQTAAGRAVSQASTAAQQAEAAAQSAVLAAQTVLDKLNADPTETAKLTADKQTAITTATGDVKTKTDAVTTAQQDLATANANVATAQAALAALPTGTDDTAAKKAVTDAQTAQKTAQKTLTDAQTALGTSYTGVDKATAGIPVSQAQEALTEAQQALAAALGLTNAVSDADWAVQMSSTPAEAQAAAAQAQAVADQANAIAGGTARPSAQGVVTQVLGLAQTLAVNAANTAATLAGTGAPPVAGQDGEPATAVVKDAVQAINDAITAARNASRAATGASQDATVAANSVTSGDPAMAARAATNNAAQAQADTATIASQANSTKVQIGQAGQASQASVAPAVNAAKAVTSTDPATGIKQALAAAQAALNAANNAETAAQLTGQAAVATSSVAVQAAKSADVAAQAAQAAVLANEEANLDPTLTIQAINEGEWGNNLEITLSATGTIFSLLVREIVVANGVSRYVATETYPSLTVDESVTIAQNAIQKVNNDSTLVRLSQIGPKIQGAYPADVGGKLLAGGTNGGLATADQIVTSMQTLDGIEPSIFNILCIPAAGNLDDAQASVVNSNALTYCQKKRAFYIADIPSSVNTVGAMQTWQAKYGNAMAYSMAVYFPRLIIPDPLNDYRPRNVGASGTMAGIYARTDTARGVWKAPAGIEAVLQGAEIAVKINDDLNGQLNPLGVNVLRAFPIYGNIAWGARTLAGADQLSSEYKYINVRRLMYYIEGHLREPQVGRVRAQQRDPLGQDPAADQRFPGGPVRGRRLPGGDAGGLLLRAVRRQVHDPPGHRPGDRQRPGGRGSGQARRVHRGLVPADRRAGLRLIWIFKNAERKSPWQIPLPFVPRSWIRC